MESTAFREETRVWLEAHCPESMRSPIRTEVDICWGGRNATFQSEDQRRWLEAMAERGWTAPTWPTEYGGGGLDGEQHKILKQELRRIGARPALTSFGISMLGPALLKFGSEALKRQHLPPIVRGEIRWCQGYSEPNAGSDLAGLMTRAEDHGDHFRVTGSKVWTSYADKSDWMFCLVRTEFEGPKHGGISFILFDMTSPGVSTRPILLISGRSPFCETFLDHVEVPKDQLVGELNQGWTIAKYLLTHEREMIATDFGMGRADEPLHQAVVEAVGRDDDRLANPMLRADLARFEIDEMAFALTVERARDETRAGVSLGATSSVFKYYGTELNKRRQALIMAAGGSEALAWEGPDDGHRARSWLRSKGNSIEGGTSEIQLNIIAKRILGLG